MVEKLFGMRKTTNPLWILAGLALLFLIAVLDYVTGTELSFSLFYLLPVFLFSFVFRGNAGTIIAFVCAGVWLFIEIMTQTENSNTLVYVWNAIIRLGFFLFPALLLKSWEREWEYARTDFLTGVFNVRYFNELLQREIDRSARYKHPFTVAFIDTDDFKRVNDTSGHAFGNSVLRRIAENMMRKLRKTDIVARIGGDEFAILLPETDASSAKFVVSKLFRDLNVEGKGKTHVITFSVGVLTVLDGVITTDEILGITDELMYLAKNTGKNTILYKTFQDGKAT